YVSTSPPSIYGHHLLSTCCETKFLQNALIKSLVALNCSSTASTVPVAAAGSGKSRWTITALPGNTGHRSFALSQTVITKSKSWERYSSTTLDVCPEISTPSSIMTAIAVGFTPCASTPALLTIALSPEKWRRYPSAIWLRQLLPVHRTNMFVILTTTLRRTTS